LIASGSLVAHNLYLRTRDNPSERHKVLANRIAVATFGVIAYVLALSSDSVYELVEAASAFRSPPILFSTPTSIFSPHSAESTPPPTSPPHPPPTPPPNPLLQPPPPLLPPLAAPALTYTAGAALGDGPRKLGNAQPSAPPPDAPPCPATEDASLPAPSNTS